MDCPICFENITKDTGQVTTSCGHTFHLKCLNRWFCQQILSDDDAKESCPCCRKEPGEFERASESEYHDEDDEEDQDDDDEDDNNQAPYEGNWVRIGERRWVIARSSEERMQILARVASEQPKEEPLHIPPYNAENHALWALRHLFDEETSPLQPLEAIHTLDKPKMLRRRQYNRGRNYWSHLGLEYELKEIDGYQSN